MDILLLLIGLVVELLAVPLLLIALIWFFFVGRRFYREKKSLDAFKGNEIAKAMTMDRIKARFIRTLGKILWPVLVVTLSFLLMDALGDASPGIAVTVASIVTLSCIAWSSLILRRYNATFKKNIVKAELSKAFDNLTYEPQGKFDQESIRNLQFFSSFDGITGNDLIVADYNGLHFAQCDMGVSERYTVTVQGSDGETRTEERWRDVFKGRAMRFDFADAFRGRVQVVSKDFNGASVKSRGEWQAVETELAEFGEYFEVYAPDPLDAMAVLTPQMIEGIFYLKKALNVPTALYFTGNAMFVFMALARETFDVSDKNTLLEESRLLKRDIALMTGFMDVMYFNRPASMEGNRAETAASVAAAAGPSEVEKITRQAGRGLGMALSLLPKAVIAAYCISAVYGFINLPGEIVTGFTLGDGLSPMSDAPQVPTIVFLSVAGVFILLPALTGHLVFSLICLTIYLIFMATNL